MVFGFFVLVSGVLVLAVFQTNSIGLGVLVLSVLVLVLGVLVLVLGVLVLGVLV